MTETGVAPAHVRAGWAIQSPRQGIAMTMMAQGERGAEIERLPLAVGVFRGHRSTFSVAKQDLGAVQAERQLEGFSRLRV